MRSSNIKALFFILLLQIILSGLVSGQQTLSQLPADPRLRAGFDLIKRGNYQAALAEFRHFSAGSGYPGDLIQTAKYYAAHCALQLDHLDAESQLLAVQTTYPGGLYENRIFLDLGHASYQKKKWEAALNYYTKIPPGSLDEDLQAEADFRAGQACFQLQQYDRAKSYFQKLRRKESIYQAPSAYFSAYLNFKDAVYDEALNDLELAVKSPEYKPLVPVLKANILYRKKDYPQVIQLAESSFSDTARIQHPEELHLLAGESHFQKRDYPKAATHFEAYAKAIRGNVGRGLQFRMAFTAFKTDQTDKAIGGFRSVASRIDTAKGKTDSLGQYSSYYLGICYLKKDQKQFALNAFDQASLMKGDPGIQEVAWFNAGKLSYDLEKYGDAVDLLKDFVEEFPNSTHATEANEIIGEGLLNSNDFEGALAYLENTRVKSDRLGLAYQRAAFQKGTVLFNESNFPKAAELFTQSLKFQVDKEASAAAQFWLGECYFKDRQFSKAQTAYLSCQKVEGSNQTPYFSKAKFGLGYASFNLKEYSKALGYFREFVAEAEKTPQRTNYADGLLRLADCLYATKDYPAALRGYDKAIDAKTFEMDYAFYQKGVVYAVLKDFENARTNFSLVVEKYKSSPLYDQALFQKAQMDFESTNYQAAIKGYSQIISNMPGSPVLPYCYLNRGASASNLKEFGAAVEDYKVILNEYPAHPAANQAILGLQEALVQTGDVDQLNVYIGKYKKANPESDALESIEFETCKALYNNQKYAKAITGFQEYLKNYPGSSFVPEARFFLAESQYRGGSKSEALVLYKEIVQQGKSNWYIRSMFRTAELEYGAGDFLAASRHYSNLLDGVARSAKDINNATLGLTECLFQLGKYDSVSVLTSELLKKENLSQDVMNKASLYAAKVFVGKGEYEKAIDELLTTVNNAQDINGAEAQYLVGDVFFRQKKYNESLAALFELKSRFSAYPKWYNKGFLLMADNYIALKENFQAQATLKSIIENASDKETIQGAKTRLNALKSEQGDEQKP